MGGSSSIFPCLLDTTKENFGYLRCFLIVEAMYSEKEYPRTHVISDSVHHSNGYTLPRGFISSNANLDAKLVSSESGASSSSGTQEVFSK